MSDFAPRTFGRYTLLRKIATGGMAEIFLARQQGPGRFERSLVIKRILPHLAADPAFVDMFLDEASLAAQLNHPHIGQVYDFGDAEGSYFIAMELIRGPDLRTLLAVCGKLQRVPPVAVSLRLITQVLSALDYAHGATDEQGVAFNLVHRDVTPQNILVTPEGMAKLVDFGIAKAATASHQTAAGMVKGKLAYLAPEQVTAQNLDGRCDQYAAALVLYDLLTLHRGLPVNGPEGLMVAVEARVTPIATYRKDLPAALVAILERALSRDREARFADCRALAVAIDEFLVGQGITVADRDVAAYLRELEAVNGAPLSELGSPLPATPAASITAVEPPPPEAFAATQASIPRIAEARAQPPDVQAGVSTMPLPPKRATPVAVLKKPTRNRLPSQAQILEALAKANAASGLPPPPGWPPPAATTSTDVTADRRPPDDDEDSLRLPAGPSTGRVPLRPSPDAPTAELHLGAPPPNEPGASTFIGIVGLRPSAAVEPEIGSFTDLPAVEERPDRRDAARGIL